MQLVVFPECTLSGYAFDSADQLRPATVTLDGPELGQFVEACRRLALYCVVGFLEREGPSIYNTAALIGPEGIVGSYRKAHLPHLAADRFVTPGPFAEPPVFDTTIGRIGLAICYDLRFPESARSLALSGADIIAQPTNSVGESAILFDHFTTVRACENRIYVAIANRPDVERSMRFMGRSQVVDPAGNVVLDAGSAEGLFSCEIDLALAREKTIVIESGTFELSVFGDRRPDLYAEITAPMPALEHEETQQDDI